MYLNASTSLEFSLFNTLTHIIQSASKKLQNFCRRQPPHIELVLVRYYGKTENLIHLPWQFITTAADWLSMFLFTFPSCHHHHRHCFCHLHHTSEECVVSLQHHHQPLYHCQAVKSTSSPYLLHRHHCLCHTSEVYCLFKQVFLHTLSFHPTKATQPPITDD